MELIPMEQHQFSRQAAHRIDRLTNEIGRLADAMEAMAEAQTEAEE